MTIPAPLSGNLALLEQGCSLLASLSDELYAGAPPERSSVGAQYRHVLDHYGALLTGLGSGLVDYDARARDPVLEASREAADRHTRDVIETLSRLGESDLPRPLLVHAAAAPEDRETPPQPSSLGRELLFVVSHTVHHFAIIRLLLEDLGWTCDTDFGVAPSTLAFRAATG